MKKTSDTFGDALSIHSGWGKMFQEAKRELNLDCSFNKWRTTHSKRLFLEDLRNDLYTFNSSDQTISFITECSKKVNPFTFGCFSLLFWTSPCIRTALKNAESYSIIMSHPIHLRNHATHNDDIEIWFIDNETISHNPTITHLGILLYMLTLNEMVQRLTDLPISPITIELASSEFTHKQLETIERVSNITINVNKARNKLCIPHHCLQINNPYHDEDIYHSQQTLVREKAGLLKTNDIILTIFNYLDSIQDLATVSVETTANQLAMSARTLNRKLNNQNTTYRDVLTHYRLEKSLRLLNDESLNITEIAFQLGFSDVSAFSRAFKSWTGNTPLELRRF